MTTPLPRTAFHSRSTLQWCSCKLAFSQASLQDLFHILQECRADPYPRSNVNVGSRTDDCPTKGSKIKGEDDYSALDDLLLHYSSPGLEPPPASRGFWETAVGRSFENTKVAWSWTGDSSTNVDHGEIGDVDVTIERRGASKLTGGQRQLSVIEVNGGARKHAKGLLAPPKVYAENVEILDSERPMEARLGRTENISAEELSAVVGSCRGGEVGRKDDNGGRQGLREDEKRLVVGGVSHTSPKDAPADGSVKPPSSEGELANDKLAQGTGTQAVRSLIQRGGRIGEEGSCEVARHEGAMVIRENRRREMDEPRSTGECVQTKTRSFKDDVMCVSL